MEKQVFQIVTDPIEVEVSDSGREVKIEGCGLHLVVYLEEDHSLPKIREGLKRLANAGRLKLAPTHLEPMLQHKDLLDLFY
jgi:hypothetical protein